MGLVARAQNWSLATRFWSKNGQFTQWDLSPVVAESRGLYVSFVSQTRLFSSITPDNLNILTLQRSKPNLLLHFSASSFYSTSCAIKYCNMQIVCKTVLNFAISAELCSQPMLSNIMSRNLPIRVTILVFRYIVWQFTTLIIYHKEKSFSAPRLVAGTSRREKSQVKLFLLIYVIIFWAFRMGNN